MKNKRILTTATFVGVLAAVGGRAISAQDKYTVKVPDGLAFSEFRGYEAWQTIAISRNERVMAVSVHERPEPLPIRDRLMVSIDISDASFLQRFSWTSGHSVLIWREEERVASARCPPHVGDQNREVLDIGEWRRKMTAKIRR